MKERNIYDIHSVYLKNRVDETSHWERIEGVYDAQARMEQKGVCKNLIQKPKSAKIAKTSSNFSGLSGAVRRVIKFLK